MVELVFIIFGYVIAFWINTLFARYVLCPLIGSDICYALNLVLNTDIFTLSNLPVIFATASFVGGVLFKSSRRVINN